MLSIGKVSAIPVIVTAPVAPTLKSAPVGVSKIDLCVTWDAENPELGIYLYFTGVVFDVALQMKRKVR